MSLAPLRLWPGVVLASLTLLAFILPFLAPSLALIGLIGGVGSGFITLLWWLFFSRAPWIERIGAILFMVVGVGATYQVVHPSIANAGMGAMLAMFSMPVLGLALVIWAIATQSLSTTTRRASLAVAIVLGCGLFTMVRTGGITGDAQSDLHWRWTPSPEERLLASTRDEPLHPLPGAPALPPSASATPANEIVPATAPPAASVSTPAATAPPVAPRDEDSESTATKTEWPGFRGSQRDDVVRGVRIATDWSKTPPVALWKRPIGPGWSSFAVHGDLIYTQEQRGDDEVVSAYKLSTGEPVWRHRDAARFWESNAGAGPRGTPAFSRGRVYSLGATGIVNALDARDGSVIWSRNASTDTGAALPGWGFAGSPLVTKDAVIVAASGRLVAYDLATGKPRWVRKTVGGGYSSPQRVTLDGVEQIVLLSGGGASSVAPADGSILWEHKWPDGSTSIVQPAMTEDGDLLIGAVNSSASGIGTRRLTVKRGASGWSVDERWTSNSLKPSFSDYVVHHGHAFGFDGGILACIDLKDGTRSWKGGRYGHGQLVLLADQDVMLVITEDGELALVSATPGQFTEIARAPAIEGKTWNHPVLVGDILLVRNGEEMAAFRLALVAP